MEKPAVCVNWSLIEAIVHQKNRLIAALQSGPEYTANCQHERQWHRKLPESQHGTLSSKEA